MGAGVFRLLGHGPGDSAIDGHRPGDGWNAHALDRGESGYHDPEAGSRVSVGSGDYLIGRRVVKRYVVTVKEEWSLS